MCGERVNGLEMELCNPNKKDKSDKVFEGNPMFSWDWNGI